MKLEKFLGVLLLLVTSGSAVAVDSLLYGGLMIGRASISFDGKDFGSGSPTNAKERTTKGHDTGFRFIIGYPINDTWAIEGGYARQGSFEYRSKDLDSIDSVFDYRASSWFLAGKARVPLTETIAFFGTLGLAVNSAETRFWEDKSRAIALPLFPGTVVSKPNLTSFVLPGHYSHSTTAPLVGLGVEYAISKSMKFRLDYENFGRFGSPVSTGRADVDMTSVGFSYRF